MHRRFTGALQTLSFILLALSPLTLFAQANAGNLAESWIVQVKNGHVTEFEAAFGEYMRMSEQQGEPRNWDVFIPDTGSNLSRYAIRHCCFAWPDQDTYTTWVQQNPDLLSFWEDKVDIHLESMEHFYYEMDITNSHWPENKNIPRLLGVTEFTIAAGKVAQFHAARAELSQIAINQGWSAAGNYWSWFDRIGGEPTAGLVIPFNNYADMAPGEQQFATFLAEQMGADKAAELMEEISSGVKSSSYTLWIHRPDLSSGKD